MKKIIYLDHAAATPLSSEVFNAMKPYFMDSFFNASAQYLAAKKVATDIGVARADIAKVLGVRPTEIVFTAGGTEANNLAIHGIMRQFPKANCITSAIEHDSVLEPGRQYRNKIGAVLSSGVIDIDSLSRQIDDNTVLISVQYANNEIGTVQPLADISHLIGKVREQRAKQNLALPLYFHTDAAQAGNYLHLLAHKLGVDLMTLNAGKLYGPKQVGALYVKTGVPLKAQILGGGQERRLRSGTENPAGIIGFASATKSAQIIRQQETARMSELRQQFIKLLEETIPTAKMTTMHKHILPNNVHVQLAGQDNERLMMGLDEAGIICAVGSACSASSDEPSHVLKAIGLSDEAARSSLRFTMGRSTNLADIQKTVEILTKLTV